MAIVRYVVTDPGAFRAPIALEAGVISDGWFWKRRPYSLYRFRTPDGAVIGHRFDAVSDVRLSVDVIEYRDLVLDWWVLPGGRIVEEDRDELESLVAAGEVSSAFARRAHDAARTVLGRYRHILDEVQRIERKLGAWAGGPG
jgi:predicted RNA-binding protein associated with RNAse of E/G family